MPDDVAGFEGIGSGNILGGGNDSDDINLRLQTGDCLHRAKNRSATALVVFHFHHAASLLKRDSTGVKSQALLIPEQVSVTEKEADLAEQYASVFARLGLEVDRSGPDRLTVRAMPTLLADADPAALLRDLLAELDEQIRTALGRLGYGV